MQPQVHCRPAWTSSNRFTKLFADAITAEGVPVFELGAGARALPAAPAIALLHWPDEFFCWYGLRKAVSAMRTLATIRARRLRLVWVVHNVRPHEGIAFPPLRSWFLSLLDGVIFMSASSRIAAVRAYPGLGRVPAVTVPHGHYVASGDPPIVPGRALDDRRPRLTMIGQMRGYKGAETFARVAPDVAAELRIVGRCRDDRLAQRLRAATADNLALRLEWLDEAAFAAEIDACDAVVLPYSATANSGTALHALSRARPVIAPRIGAFSELEGIVGSDWVWLYDGALSAAVLTRAAAWLAARPVGAAPNLTYFDWAPIGHTLAQFLRRIDAA